MHAPPPPTPPRPVLTHDETQRACAGAVLTTRLRERAQAGASYGHSCRKLDAIRTGRRGVCAAPLAQARAVTTVAALGDLVGLGV
jgi:hypothetical protein